MFHSHLPIVVPRNQRGHTLGPTGNLCITGFREIKTLRLISVQVCFTSRIEISSRALYSFQRSNDNPLGSNAKATYNSFMCIKNINTLFIGGENRSRYLMKARRLITRLRCTNDEDQLISKGISA